MSPRPVTATAAPPSFSVATPTRNDLGKLRRCVGSVRGQRGQVSVEHLVHDAVSGDGTADWLAGQPDLNWVSERDEGMYDAINRAWARSSGRILSWLNADEQYLPGTLARVEKYFDAHPETDVLFGNYIVCTDEGRPIAQRQEIPFRRWYVINSFLNAQSCTLFFRRSLLERGLLSFDQTLRYAADKDLLLKMQAEGVRIDHLAEYLALFGIDGTNLSTHPQMAAEAETVRLRYGAYRHRPLRVAALMCRRAERMLRGAYANRPLSFHFALDEVPNYREIRTAGLGGRYSLADANQG